MLSVCVCVCRACPRSREFSGRATNALCALANKDWISEEEQGESDFSGQVCLPDLNPIEHLWGILKRQVEHHSPSSIQSLKEFILEEWKKIDLAKCRHLFIPCLEDLVLSLKIMEAIQSTRFSSFCCGVYSFCITLIWSKLKKL